MCVLNSYLSVENLSQKSVASLMPLSVIDFTALSSQIANITAAYSKLSTSHCLLHNRQTCLHRNEPFNKRSSIFQVELIHSNSQYATVCDLNDSTGTSQNTEGTEEITLSYEGPLTQNSQDNEGEDIAVEQDKNDLREDRIGA
ncbi:hypothetical protein GJ496_003286 [Pomphorhynchus laevis]|nr:hypothetical protein GJ496_003286 [Pomphorhynchus laevis]